ncbi:cytochrome c biogenesis protein ResB [Brevibacillus agri]|uniref:Cytochrome c biogenesis protein ResB n=1 Tax=Brevibacillus agri TaxID=51101 RepID=A0A3M8AQ49_9BACL|nr:cytochrome c biogenesis protein ResB [Brevibacillus agri]QAV14320.1 cytochrome c biogenesis protein ResB [Brevibacillus agri]RNB53322.1 cytochrome c biogenesis protein ResB [Brevibacillus agri]WHX32955.1 cytochrome c biogenesis protein ResB [Brevibacillus agri]GED24028.1 cytochrome c biogenesis protein ResB [Brevibacillus agri]
MDQRKCECGHTNPVGTLLCESCGKPLNVEVFEQIQFPDMRYEGMARRSQTYTKKWIDRIWNTFSSVKIAIGIIIVILVASAVGTVFPQQQYIPVPVPTEADVARFYTDTYGTLGTVYYGLGFHNLYSSWWFVTLLVLLGTSLVICSLDRVVPLYKALSKPRLNQHKSFLKGQKLFGEGELAPDADQAELLERSAAVLKKKGYRIFRAERAIMAEKGRFSRWGPYINHIGLILFLIGVLMRNIPGFYLDEFVWVREGQTVAIPETPYYIKSENYQTTYWSEEEMPEKLELNGGVIPKSFQTDAVLYLNKNADVPGKKPDLVEVQKGPIIVNHPMIEGDIAIYQSGVQEMQLGALNFVLVDVKNGDKELGAFKVDLYNPAVEQEVAAGIKVRVLDYFPDFIMGSDGKPATKTNLPKNPMVALEIVDEATQQSEKLVYLQGSVLTQKSDARFGLTFHKPDLIDISGLNVRIDKAVPLIYFGAFIFMIGVAMGFFWQHRRIWVQTQDGTILLAAHTNKNWFGLRREVDGLVEQLQLPVTMEEKTKA